MLLQINDLLAKVKQEEHLRSKAELDFLQAQINPHFIHNSLFSIKCLIEMGKLEDAKEMLGAFIWFLKGVLNNKDKLSTLDDEINCTRQYLLIQNYLCENKIDFLLDLSPESLSCFIPRLLLQPIVENSIVHGFVHRQDNRIISIYSKIQLDKLELVIRDNGVGISKEKRDHLLENNPLKSSKTSGIGIVNIKERLAHIFGNQYSFEISSIEGEGTNIRIVMPKIQ